MFKRRIWVLITTLVVVFSISMSNYSWVSAESVNAKNEEQKKNEFIQKVTPYVYLNHNTEKFQLKKSAVQKLTSKEIKKAKKIISNTNGEVKEYRSDLKVSGDKFISNQTAPSKGMSTYAINKKENFDWEFTWWGLKVYWSHKFVNKLKSNLILYGSATAALNATIGYFLSPPGWVTSLVTAVAGIGVWTFIKQDKGCGVYLDCYVYVPSRWYSAC